MFSYEQFYRQYVRTKNELEFSAEQQRRPMRSIYEVGCGCGANLFLFQNDGIEVGGIDYSSSEIEIAGKVLIHDSTKKDAFIAYRKNIIEDYEERYKDLPKFFYEKAFFWNLHSSII